MHAYYTYSQTSSSYCIIDPCPDTYTIASSCMWKPPNIVHYTEVSKSTNPQLKISVW